MEAYAVMETGGKQYRVQKGDELDVELLDGEPGQTVALERVLAVSDGEALTVGRPTVEGARVSVSIVDQHRGPKLVAFKKKRRKGYHKKIGHRQEAMRVRVESIDR